MNKLLRTLSVIVVSSLLLASCSGGAKGKKGDVSDLKAKLEKLKKKKSDLEADIRKLDEQIKKADPEGAKQNAVLVAVATVEVDSAFEHFIELQGKINTDEGIAYVAPKGQGGLVKAVLVKPGQRVSKGQLVVKLDDAAASQQVATAKQGVAVARQQLGMFKARLDQAQAVYTRYQNLWNQGIGAEVQVINAKADVDALSAQVRGAEAGVGTAMAGVSQAQEAVNMSNVYAGISGTVEQVNVRVGEFFTGVSPDRKPQVLIVNDNASVKAEVPVPDKYASKVVKDARVQVEVPDLDTTFEAKITMVGGAIDPTTRSFMAEAKLGVNKMLKPNLTATIRIQDDVKKDVVVIDAKLVQPDEKGKFVYIVVNEGGKMIARKRSVTTIGEVYKGKVAIKKEGLIGGEMIITEGFQNVYDGQLVRTK